MGLLGKGDDLVEAILDMSRKARMKRAADQGFDTDTVWYHGTNKDVDSFNPSMAKSEGGATFLTTNKVLASRHYAGGRGGNVMPVYLKKGAIESGYPMPSNDALDAMSKDDISRLLDDADRWNESLDKRAYLQSEIAKAGGSDVVFRELDDPNYYEPFGLTVSDVAAVQTPSNIRSVNAAFDPAKKDSSNLLASMAGAGILGGGLYSEDADAGPLQAGAKRLLDDRFLGALGGSAPRVALKDTVAGMETGILPRNMDYGENLSLYDLEGHPYILTQSDRSAAGGEIISVHGTSIDPVDLRGGRDFMFDEPSAGQVWASDPNVVKGLYRRAGGLSKEYGKDTILLPYSMAPTGIDFATMPLETMIAYAREGMGGGNIKKLDRAIKKIIPEWKGVADPNAVQVFRDVKGPKRKAVADLIDKKFRDVPGGMSISEARAATTDSAQYLSPEGQVVNVGRIDSGRPIIEDSGHPTYLGGLPGEGMGRLTSPVDVRPFLAHNGRNITGDAADIRSLSMNHGLSQGVIDEELLGRIYGTKQSGQATPSLLGAMAAGSVGGAGLYGSIPAEQASTERSPHFVERANNPSIFPVVNNPDGSQSSHRMSAEVDENGQWWSFPTVVQNSDGSYRQFDDPYEALRYNKRIGNALKMPDKDTAIEYSKGGYKQGQFWDMMRNPQQPEPNPMIMPPQGIFGGAIPMEQAQEVSKGVLESLDYPLRLALGGARLVSGLGSEQAQRDAYGILGRESEETLFDWGAAAQDAVKGTPLEKAGALLGTGIYSLPQVLWPF